jgi:hypothetical protein
MKKIPNTPILPPFSPALKGRVFRGKEINNNRPQELKAALSLILVLALGLTSIHLGFYNFTTKHPTDKIGDMLVQSFTVISITTASLILLSTLAIAFKYNQEKHKI